MNLSTEFVLIARGENMDTEKKLEELKKQVDGMKNVIIVMQDRAVADALIMENINTQIGVINNEIQAIESLLDARDHRDTIESVRPTLY